METYFTTFSVKSHFIRFFSFRLTVLKFGLPLSIIWSFIQYLWSYKKSRSIIGSIKGFSACEFLYCIYPQLYKYIIHFWSFINKNILNWFHSCSSFCTFNFFCCMNSYNAYENVFHTTNSNIKNRQETSTFPNVCDFWCLL